MKSTAFFLIAALCLGALLADRLTAQPSGAATPPFREQVNARNKPKASSRDRQNAATEGIRTGFAGHYACRVFTGPARQLAIAISDEEPEEVRRLIAAGANVEARSTGKSTHGMPMLQVAVWYGWTAGAVELLIEAGADVNAKDSRGNTALVHATQCQPANRSAVELLVRSGADVNFKDRRGMTPLMNAALYDDSAKTIEVLVKGGARVGMTDRTGWTALMHATRRRRENEKMVTALLEAGAQVNATHQGGGTALASAALNGQTKVVDLLLRAGARVNVQDAAGWTPLLCAAQGGHTSVVEQLLKAGARTDAADRLGRTPLKLATTNEHEQTAALLRKAGGR